MRADELRALGDLGGEAASGIAGQARDVHGAVADRVFGTLAACRLPTFGVRGLHDTISAGAYDAARMLSGVIVRAGARAGAGALARGPDAPSLADSPRGRLALAVVGAAHGDRLATGSPLTEPLRLLVDDRRAPSGRLAVFVHGLGETEDSWRRPPGRGPSYGDRLAADHGFTPLYARYTTGRRVATSGAELTDALGETVAAWPVPVTEIVLIGHSMGGLVARVAAQRGAGTPWGERLRHVVSLGAPHEGAPLARVVHGAGRALERLPETRPFAAGLRLSDGIDDLRDGGGTSFAAHAEHWLVSASVTRNPEAPAGRLFGDLLVTRRSAWAQRGRTERLRLPPDHYRHLGGATHFDLLGHPAVGALLSEWLAPQPALTAASS